jgi:integrase
MWTLRVFLKWAASIEAVPANLYDKVMVPDINRDQRQSEEMLEGDTAEDILEYLSRYHYASRRHVIISLLWETGIRIGAAISIDREEMYLKDGYIDLVHRPDEGTTLKNGKGGERPIAITEGLSELLEEYIENNRLASVDDYGRHPLITGRFGRLTRTSYRRAVYQTTSPCFRGQSCPGCIDDPKKAVRRQSILMRFGAAV